jgi:hypothetical protein
VALSVRYQKGRRDDRIAAAVRALYWDRSSEAAWSELVDVASAAPHIPTLLEIFRRVPVSARQGVLSMLINLSRGTDRLGNMQSEAGEQLRARLAEIAAAEGDRQSTAKLSRGARRHVKTRTEPAADIEHCGHAPDP